MDKKGLGKKDDFIVLGGFSAGSRGAMAHLDWVGEMMRDRGAKVLGFLDSPLMMDVDPLYDSVEGLNSRLRTAFINYQLSPIIPRDCRDKHGPTNNEWRCIFPQFRLEFLKTPFVIVGDQYDSYEASVNLNGKDVNQIDKLTAFDKVYLKNFAAFTK